MVLSGSDWIEVVLAAGGDVMWQLLDIGLDDSTRHLRMGFQEQQRRKGVNYLCRHIVRVQGSVICHCQPFESPVALLLKCDER